MTVDELRANQKIHISHDVQLIHSDWVSNGSHDTHVAIFEECDAEGVPIARYKVTNRTREYAPFHMEVVVEKEVL